MREWIYDFMITSRRGIQTRVRPGFEMFPMFDFAEKGLSAERSVSIELRSTLYEKAARRRQQPTFTAAATAALGEQTSKA